MDFLAVSPLLPDVARFRCVVYRLLGALFLHPDEDRLATLRTAAAELQERGEPEAAFAFFDSWQRLLAVLTGLAKSATGQVEEEYVRLFLVNPLAPPHEAFYLDSGRQARGWIVAELGCEYKHAGLAVSPSLRELPDHVAVELEFMAFLCDRETQAWGAEPEKCMEALKLQRDFLGHHLGRWFSQFAQRVRQTAPEGIYDVGVEAAEAFIKHDFDLLNLLMEGVTPHEGRPPSSTAHL